jgi:hypothetical protein
LPSKRIPGRSKTEIRDLLTCAVVPALGRDGTNRSCASVLANGILDPMTKTPSLFDLAFPDSPDLKIEKKHAKSFDGMLCGVDEAGRGPWAGPVVTAAVILDYKNVPAGLNDSKKLTEAKRESLFGEILRTGWVCAASASPCNH